MIQPTGVFENVNRLRFIQISSKRLQKDTGTKVNNRMLLKRGTGNGERGTGNGERGTGNGERESGNECRAVTRLRILNGGGNRFYCQVAVCIVIRRLVFI